MHITDLKKHLEVAQLPVYFITGDDLYLQELAITLFCQIIDAEYADFNINYFDSAEFIKDIISACNTVPVFSDKKVVIVKTVNRLDESGKKQLEQYLKNHSIFTVLIIIDDAEKSKLNNFYKYGEMVDCNRGNAFQVSGWIQDYVHNNGKKIEKSAVDLLVKYTSQNMKSAVNELHKLFSYCENDVIKKSDIELLVTPDEDFVGYNFTNAISNGQNNEALEILQSLIDKGEKASMLLAFLNNQYRRMLQARISSLSSNELAVAMGVKPYAITVAKNLSQKYTQVELKSIVDDLHNLEYAFKSGVMGERDALLQAVAILLKKV